MSEITYQLVVNSSGAVKSIQQIEGELNQATQAANSFSNATKNVNKGLGTQERSANLAGAAALELSRIASDAAYGIRGMANNIGQLVTMFAMLAAQTNATTGATLGFMGAIKATWAAIKGPLGIVMAIQGLLTVLTLWEANTQKQKKAQKELNDEVEKTSRLSRDFAGDISAMVTTIVNSTGSMQKVAVQNLEKIVPRLRELLNEGYAYEEIQQLAIRYQRALVNEKKLSEELSEEKKSELSTNLSVLAVQSKLNDQTEERIWLETKLFGIKEANRGADEKAIKTRKKLGYLIDDELNRIVLSNKGWKDVFDQIAGDQMTTHQQFIESLGELHTGSKYFMSETLKDVRLFSSHLMSVSDIMYSFGDISHSVYDTMSKDTAKARKDAKILFDTMKSFAIAAITVNTLVAASKVEGVTVLDRSLQMAAIIAQGVAQVIAVASQKMDGTSKLKGANVNAGSTGSDDTIPVATTGFSNLGGGEKPNSAIRVYVLEQDVRTVGDKSQRTKARARL